MRKPVFGVSDEVPHKPGCTTTQGSRGIVLSMERKQRCCTASLFTHMQKDSFLTTRLIYNSRFKTAGGNPMVSNTVRLKPVCEASEDSQRLVSLDKAATNKGARLYIHRMWSESFNFNFMKKRDIVLFEPRCEKTVFRVSVQVRHKPGCAATENA